MTFSGLFFGLRVVAIRIQLDLIFTLKACFCRTRFFVQKYEGIHKDNIVYICTLFKRIGNQSMQGQRR